MILIKVVKLVIYEDWLLHILCNLHRYTYTQISFQLRAMTEVHVSQGIGGHRPPHPHSPCIFFLATLCNWPKIADSCMHTTSL
jgi:hypothetical protein